MMDEYGRFAIAYRSCGLCQKYASNDPSGPPLTSLRAEAPELRLLKLRDSANLRAMGALSSVLDVTESDHVKGLAKRALRACVGCDYVNAAIRKLLEDQRAKSKRPESGPDNFSDSLAFLD
jgi:hypothetical protein